MTKSTQAKLADWTLGFGISSFVMPIVALIVLGGFGSANVLWFQLAGLVVFAGISLWMLSRSAKDQFAYPVFCWLTSVMYFATVMVVVFATFRSPTVVGIFCIPEVAGILLSLVGLGHLMFLRRKTSNIPESQPQDLL
jgi:hypothetical protein